MFNLLENVKINFISYNKKNTHLRINMLMF